MIGWCQKYWFLTGLEELPPVKEGKITCDWLTHDILATDWLSWLSSPLPGPPALKVLPKRFKKSYRLFFHKNWNRRQSCKQKIHSNRWKLARQDSKLAISELPELDQLLLIHIQQCRNELLLRILCCFSFPIFYLKKYYDYYIQKLNFSPTHNIWTGKLKMRRRRKIMNLIFRRLRIVFNRFRFLRRQRIIFLFLKFCPRRKSEPVKNRRRRLKIKFMIFWRLCIFN